MNKKTIQLRLLNSTQLTAEGAERTSAEYAERQYMAALRSLRLLRAWPAVKSPCVWAKN